MTVDIQSLKRARLKTIQGQETVHQVAYLPQAGAILSLDVLQIPGDVVTADISAAPYLVGIGSILRIQVTGDTYIAFGNPDNGFAGPITAATSPALKLSAGYYFVVATDNFVMASTNPARVELNSLLPSQG
jgi:hypothetical protein